MKIVSFKNISDKDKDFLRSAKKAAEHSVTERGHRVGCVIACADRVFMGATVGRTRAIGSTCAERMALDQWYFNQPKVPETCYLVGTFARDNWKDDHVTTPCGVCLEMFLEFYVGQKMRKLRFVCANWKLTRVLVADLSELFPQKGKGKWPYKMNTKRR